MFDSVMERIMHTENSSKYFLHQESLNSNVETYKAALPEKLDPCKAHVEALLGELQNISILVSCDRVGPSVFSLLKVFCRPKAKLACSGNHESPK